MSMHNEQLYIIMLHTAEGAVPRRIAYTETDCGFDILRETSNCWYLDDPPHGLPERYRKADEYILGNNKFGIYIFGRDSQKVIEEWNKATSAKR